MSPIFCANEPYCQNYVKRIGELCDACKKKEEKKQKDRWKYAGWTREDERHDLNHNKGN